MIFFLSLLFLLPFWLWASPVQREREIQNLACRTATNRRPPSKSRSRLCGSRESLSLLRPTVTVNSTSSSRRNPSLFPTDHVATRRQIVCCQPSTSLALFLIGLLGPVQSQVATLSRETFVATPKDPPTVARFGRTLNLD